MIDYRSIERRPSTHTLLKFGLTLVVGCGLLAALLWLGMHRPGAAQVVAGAGLAGFVLALVPGVGRIFYFAWMALGVTLGLVTSPIVLAVIYLLLFVPMGLLFRVMGRDPLKRAPGGPSQTFWEDRAPVDDPTRFLRQY
jgi:hypothetical protein